MVYLLDTLYIIYLLDTLHNVHNTYLDVHTVHCTYVDDISIGDPVHNIYFTYLDVKTLYSILAASPLASSGFAAIGDWKGLCPFQTSIF